MSKVVHLSDEAHKQAKEYCKSLGFRMSDWVADLILTKLAELRAAQAEPEEVEVTETVTAVLVPAHVPENPAAPRRVRKGMMAVEKKKTLDRLEEVETPEEPSGIPDYSRPPFWAKEEPVVEVEDMGGDLLDPVTGQPLVDPLGNPLTGPGSVDSYE